MITLTLDMRQYDCPFIDTSDDYDLSFTTLHWDFNPTQAELETRILVDGADEGALNNGLQALDDHPNLYDHELLSKRGSSAHIRTVIGETNAMGTIRDYDGYITGPFHIEDGTEEWHVGFDSNEVAGDALSGLDTSNDYTVESRDAMDVGVLQRFARNVDAAATLVEGCMELSDVERETLRTAVDEGYFNNPRDASLDDLAAEFDVSSSAVSKNMRRAQRKIVGQAVDAIEEME
ncbi:helix-turn-helix domain-containing protein [Halobacteriales archaeon QS_1_68_20]|nr:MAG: helix-turn-helix domain-containing protein [Halobacteriales archaeon QS_1_68_20]